MPFAFQKSVLSACLLAAASFACADEYSDVGNLMRAGQQAQALAKAEQFLAAKPKDPQMRFIKGVIQAETGKSADAIVTFTKLTEEFPELPEPYNNLAVIYAAQSQFDKARSALEMAIRTNPSYSTAHENLGDVYARLASQAYSKALQLDSSNTAVQPKLSLIKDIFAPGAKGVKPSATGKVTPAPTVAAAAPAAATAKPAAPAAATEAPSKAAAGADSSAVENAIKAWASAWSSKNMDGYLAAYGPGFDNGGKKSRKEWEEDRRARIMGKSNISVQVSDLRVQTSGDKATAVFRQHYKADKMVVSSKKTLDLVQSGGRWLIVHEKSK